jgi:hypothetical protein
MAAQARLRATDSGGVDDSDRDALALASVPLCLLHDLVGVAAFLASHPLHAFYLLFFARHLASLAGFFCPLLVSTGLLLAVFATAGPYLGGAEWPGASSLGRTCGVAVAALCAELQPDGACGAGLVAQLCSFVLGPGDDAAVDRVGEIMGELCDVTASCFVVLEVENSLLLVGGKECKDEIDDEVVIPLMDNATTDERSLLDHDDCCEEKDEIDDKVVISEDLKGSESSTEQCRQSEAGSVQEIMEAEEDPEIVIQEQGLIASDTDAIVEKRLECDPVSVEIKKCASMQTMELEVKKCEPAMEVKEVQSAEWTGNKEHEPVKQRSSIAQRIKQWEAQVSGNIKTVIEDGEDISVKIKDVKKCLHFEADPCVDRKLIAQDTTSGKQSVEQEHGQEFKDVEECVPSETDTPSEICGRDSSQAEENAPAPQSDQVPKDVQPEQDTQERQAAQPERDLQEIEEYEDVTESMVTTCNERAEDSPKPTSIAGRVRSRTSSENLVSDEGSPPQKEREWKRTLACKLYEERMQLRLCRDRAVVEGSDNMDMLWEAYEVGGGVRRGGIKVKSSNKAEGLVEEDEESEEHGDDEGSVRQLCCLQALKFSTKKMGFGGGKPSLAKISKVLRRMAVLSRAGSRRSHKVEVR